MKLMQSALAGVIGAMFAVSAFATDITGAGSTFAAPIYTKWADAYQKNGRRQGELARHRLVGRRQTNHREDGGFRGLGRTAER